MKKRRKSRAKTSRPKGSHPLPTGGYVSETVHAGKGGKQIRVRGVRHAEPDVRKLTAVLLEMARERARGSADDT